MKRIFLVILIFCLYVATSVSASPAPQIDVQNVNPQQPEPGETVEVSILVKNEGSSEATFSALDVETVEGVRFRGTTSNFQSSFSLCGGCQRTGLLYFKIDESADSGTYPVDLEISTGDTGIVEKFRISVEGNPQLVVNYGTIDIIPGENLSTDVEIRNTGTKKASEILLSENSEKFNVKPSELSLGTLEPGESVSRTLEITSDEDADSGIEKIEMKLEYRNDSGIKQKKSRIPVEILDRADLTISDVEVEDATIGKESTVTVELENLGPGDAERISSTLECETADVRSDRAFVGQLNDDESVPMVFKVVPNSENPSCSVSVTYNDRQNNSFEEDFNFSASEQNSMIIPAVVALIIIIGAVFYWRKRRKDELEEI